MKYSCYVFLFILLAACRPEKAEIFTVEGTFTGAPGATIMLAELPFKRPQRLVLDSATLTGSGRFKLSAVQKGEGMYQLFISNGPGILLINDTSHIVVHASVDSLHKYQVQQSGASKSLKSLYEQLTILRERATSINQLADSIANTKMADTLKRPYLQAAEEHNKAIGDFLTAYLNLENNGTAAWYTLGIAPRFLSKDQWAVQLEKALANHPGHPGLKQMKASLDKANADIASGVALLNKPVPDLILPDTTGKPVSVSSFRGRWLLIDFWASWCTPCRKQNPGLLSLYLANRSKNFSLLSVSLDKEREAWTTAISQDSLIWPQLSDLKDWESEATKTYGFNRLPFNMLINPAGNVVAVNLRGEALKQKLQEVLQ